MQFTFGFLAKKIIAAMLLPPVLPLVVILIGLLITVRKRRLGLAFAWLGLLLGLFLSTPVTVSLLTRPLENFTPASSQAVAGTQAIVILGGGQRRDAIEYGASAPNRITLERLRYGARLARQSHLPVLVTGGAPTGLIPEADAMADALRNEFGVLAKWVERESLDTADNARFCAKILKNAGIRRITLVTHAAHMRRSITEFTAAGLDVTPAPTVFFSSGPNGEEFFDFIPNMNSAYAGWYALHEWIGIGAQKIRMMTEKKGA